MARPFRQQIDAGILDRAAALFARHGFEQTSVQAVADAVGLSKAGLLHHFPSKDALHEAVRAQVDTLGAGALDQVRDLPPGAARDHRAIEVLVDTALAHPGLVSFLLTPATQGVAVGEVDTDPASSWAFAAFDVDPRTAERERCVRVAGALVALAVLALGARQSGEAAALRPHIIATSFDALGHRSPGAPPTRSDQVEA
ncbi:Transcriptional regulator, TetR family [Modestobacter italicus]|uniref:Transcriptional regulator, TetR family n=1 Tax=Modestobacter italicus (strain DSM 44449 / CECT 9708 / BC 501) TaxID=2732864 RepID=I4EWJ4_MODI5|nr:helix-turn-helix domain-containing protein [Modestobacter marinus]CCH87757.1 Transcriptional regulator, TetR family [Modestobacter marinus]